MLVNGIVVINEGEHSGAVPGKVLCHKSLGSINTCAKRLGIPTSAHARVCSVS